MLHNLYSSVVGSSSSSTIEQQEYNIREWSVPFYVPQFPGSQ